VALAEMEEVALSRRYVIVPFNTGS
jgi:hypothetical protein